MLTLDEDAVARLLSAVLAESAVTCTACQALMLHNILGPLLVALHLTNTACANRDANRAALTAALGL